MHSVMILSYSSLFPCTFNHRRPFLNPVWKGTPLIVPILTSVIDVHVSDLLTIQSTCISRRDFKKKKQSKAVLVRGRLHATRVTAALGPARPGVGVPVRKSRILEKAGRGHLPRTPTAKIPLPESASMTFPAAAFKFRF